MAMVCHGLAGLSPPPLWALARRQEMTSGGQEAWEWFGGPFVQESCLFAWIFCGYTNSSTVPKCTCYSTKYMPKSSAPGLNSFHRRYLCEPII